MMAKTMAKSTGIVTTKMSAERTSIVNAMIIEPNTTIGERSSSRSVRLRPVCTWFMSLVIRVTSVAGPMVSSSAYDSDWICAKSAWRRLAVAPVAALAEKYCAQVALAKPHRPRPTSSRHFFRI